MLQFLTLVHKSLRSWKNILTLFETDILMEYLKKQFEGVGNVFFFKRNDSESIAEARANVQEISDVHRNCENHERANAVMTSVVEADDVNGRIRGIASNSVCSTVQQKQNKGSSTNANQTETEWRNGEGTSPKDAEKLSQNFEQSDSPEIARNIMSQDSFVTVTTESGKVSECFTFTKPVEIEKEIERTASEENRQPSTMTATLAREFGHGRKLERTKYEGDDIEDQNDCETYTNKKFVQCVKNYCFSLSNTQIWDVLVAIVVLFALWRLSVTFFSQGFG